MSVSKVLHRVALALFCTSLFVALPAFANPPADNGGNNGGNNAGATDDGGNNGDNNGGERQWDAGEQEAVEEALNNLTQDTPSEDNISESSIQERANLPASSDSCLGMPENMEQWVGNDHGQGYGKLHCNRIVTSHTQNIGGEDVIVQECEYDCTYQRYWSCFPPEAKILMGDGSYKEIRYVREGDMVWNPARQKAMKVGNRLSGPEAKPLVQIGYEGATVTVTDTHPMVVRSGDAAGIHPASLSTNQNSQVKAKIKKASEVTTNDWIMGADGEFHKVSTAKMLPVKEGQVVYNFELDTPSNDLADHMIVAEGIVTGDVRVQADYNGYKLPWDSK